MGATRSCLSDFLHHASLLSLRGNEAEKLITDITAITIAIIIPAVITIKHLLHVTPQDKVLLLKIWSPDEQHWEPLGTG